VRIRRTARVVVVNERQQELLVRYEDAITLDPTQPDLTVYWGTVGGGLEEGEYPVSAYRGRTPVIEAPSLRAGWMPKLQMYDATRYDWSRRADCHAGVLGDNPTPIGSTTRGLWYTG
jgi:hypothetical protein